MMMCQLIKVRWHSANLFMQDGSTQINPKLYGEDVRDPVSKCVSRFPFFNIKFSTGRGSRGGDTTTGFIIAQRRGGILNCFRFLFCGHHTATYRIIGLEL